MPQLKYFIIIILSLIISIACSRVETSQKDTDAVELKSPKENTSIIASIVSIDETKRSPDKNSPCSKVACWANIKIDKVISRGHGGPNLNTGDKMTVNFKFTLSETTKELIPNLKNRMPGLSIGDQFTANIKLLSDINSEKLYEIYYYTKN